MRRPLSETVLADCIQTLSRDGVLAYPTETFYGLGVNAESSDALEHLAALKGRIKGNPFPLLLPSFEALQTYAKEVPPAAEALCRYFWPGPLTIVLPARGLPNSLMGPSGGVGFRVSSNPVASEIVRAFGRCITATSANPTGTFPARSLEEVRQNFPRAHLHLVDGGTLHASVPSTVIDVCTSQVPKILREGAIAPVEIETFLRKKDLWPK